MWDVREHSTAEALHWALHPEHPADRRTASRKPCSEPARGAARLSAGVLALGWILHAASAQAVEFSYGNLQGNLDTTISHGQAFRVGRRDDRLTSDINGNDGNLNYDYGLISFTNKFTSDLELNYDSFGIFVRATGFVDSENESGSRQRTQLSAAAKDLVAKDFEVLDAYVTGGLELGGVTTDLRFGKHVLNWGESTFIQNGINALNPFDVSKLRLPGSELREALEPVAMVSLSVVPTDAVSVEGFYQIDWEETEIDPVGSYFSVTDYVGAGARKAILVLPGSPGFEFGRPPVPEPGPDDEGDPDFLSVLRGPDREPSNAGQWGLALRYLAEELNETEFGFYFVNYHSRLPVVGARTGTEEGINEGLTADTEGDSRRTIRPSRRRRLNCGRVCVPMQSVMCGQIAAQAQAQAQPQVQAQATPFGIDIYGKTGNYFIHYPEDIQLFGVSFNSQLGASGWALQGEYSFRRDAPQQVAEAVVLGAGLAPFTRRSHSADLGPAPNYLGLADRRQHRNRRPRLYPPQRDPDTGDRHQGVRPHPESGLLRVRGGSGASARTRHVGHIAPGKRRRHQRRQRHRLRLPGSGASRLQQRHRRGEPVSVCAVPA